MRVAVIGSRTLHLENLSDYLPNETTEIVSGGAKGIDADAKKYAQENEITLFIQQSSQGFHVLCKGTSD